MRRLFSVLCLAVMMLCALPAAVTADIIGNVTLQVVPSSPTGYVTLPGNVYGNYYLDYDVKINGGLLEDGFCVENVSAPATVQNYTLLSVTPDLSDYGYNPANYMTAAWIATYWSDNYRAASEAWKAGAQIAIWESVFDTTFDLSSGNFKANNSYSDEALAIWAARPETFGPSYDWALAVNPTIDPTRISKTDYQNYLVQSVPEPASASLLVLGLMGILGVRRHPSMS